MEKAHSISLEMLQQRGYTIEDFDDTKIVALKPNGDYVTLFLCDTEKFNVERISQYIGILKGADINFNHCIIVHRNNITPVAKKVVEESKEIKIELFNQDELQYNITKHFLVPKHEVFLKPTDNDYLSFKKKYHADKFPIILKSDPVSRFFNFEKNDIIKVTRKNGIIMYRIVR
jgi:DNA-directed RNA polymerase I, II, and III subunit RPABC1